MLEQIKLLHRAWKYRLKDDKAEINCLRTLVKKGDTVFDVGAHKGGYTYWLQEAVGTNGKVVAFEPQQNGATLLKKLFPSENVRIENKALSNKVGEQPLYILPQRNLVSFEASLENKYSGATNVTVEATTIDHYCQQHGLHPQFLKIDVEGHEMEVLEGSFKTIDKYRPAVLMEMEERHSGRDKMSSIFCYFTLLDYKCSFFLKGTKVALEYFDVGLYQHISLLETAPQLYCNNFLFEPLP